MASLPLLPSNPKSKFEEQAIDYFINRFPRSTFEYVIPSCGKSWRYDVFLTIDDVKYLVEIDGEQHFRGGWGKEKELNFERDSDKTILALDSSYKLVRIHYKDILRLASHFKEATKSTCNLYLSSPDCYRYLFEENTMIWRERYPHILEKFSMFEVQERVSLCTKTSPKTPKPRIRSKTELKEEMKKVFEKLEFDPKASHLYPSPADLTTLFMLSLREDGYPFFGRVVPKITFYRNDGSVDLELSVEELHEEFEAFCSSWRDACPAKHRFMVVNPTHREFLEKVIDYFDCRLIDEKRCEKHLKHEQIHRVAWLSHTIPFNALDGRGEIESNEKGKMWIEGWAAQTGLEKCTCYGDRFFPYFQDLPSFVSSKDNSDLNFYLFSLMGTVCRGDLDDFCALLSYISTTIHVIHDRSPWGSIFIRERHVNHSSRFFLESVLLMYEYHGMLPRIREKETFSNCSSQVGLDKAYKNDDIFDLRLYDRGLNARRVRDNEYPYIRVITVTQSLVRNEKAHEINFLGRSQRHNEQYKKSFIESGGWYFVNGDPKTGTCQLETFDGNPISKEIVAECSLNPLTDTDHSSYLQRLVHESGFVEKLSYFLLLFRESKHFEWMLHYGQTRESYVYSILTSPGKK